MTQGREPIVARTRGYVSCVFLWLARTTCLSEQHQVLFPSNFRILVLLSQEGCVAMSPVFRGWLLMANRRRAGSIITKSDLPLFH